VDKAVVLEMLVLVVVLEVAVVQDNQRPESRVAQEIRQALLLLRVVTVEREEVL
jgi:hypothetical protein